MATMEDLEALIARLHRQGQTTLSAGEVARHLWPNSRGQNVNGQVFPLGAGAAGRMLRRCKVVWEIEPRRWAIIPERLV